MSETQKLFAPRSYATPHGPFNPKRIRREHVARGRDAVRSGQSGSVGHPREAFRICQADVSSSRNPRQGFLPEILRREPLCGRNEEGNVELQKLERCRCAAGVRDFESLIRGPARVHAGVESRGRHREIAREQLEVQTYRRVGHHHSVVRVVRVVRERSHERLRTRLRVEDVVRRIPGKRRRVVLRLSPSLHRRSPPSRRRAACPSTRLRPCRPPTRRCRRRSRPSPAGRCRPATTTQMRRCSCGTGP